MLRRWGRNHLQSWKEGFVQLMKHHKPQDNWTLDVSEDLNLSPYGWYSYRQTHLFARFECSSCSGRWKSVWSAILFHIYFQKAWGQNQGQVKMRLLGQKCHRCPMPRYEEPVFSEAARDTILYNLTLKILEKSYGEPRRSPRPCAIEERVEGPHDKHNCEACKLGMCAETHTSWPMAMPTSPAPSAETQRNIVSPAAVPQPAEEERCLKILLFLLVVIVVACLLLGAFRHAKLSFF